MAKPSKPLAQATARTEVRNSPIPKIAARPATSRVVTQEMIAKRAYEIHASGRGGSELDNWLRAERELRGV
jgi:hypothetical protein